MSVRFVPDTRETDLLSFLSSSVPVQVQLDWNSINFNFYQHTLSSIKSICGLIACPKWLINRKLRFLKRYYWSLDKGYSWDFLVEWRFPVTGKKKTRFILNNLILWISSTEDFRIGCWDIANIDSCRKIEMKN